jgi:hypothetical protein
MSTVMAIQMKITQAKKMSIDHRTLKNGYELPMTVTFPPIFGSCGARCCVGMNPPAQRAAGHHPTRVIAFFVDAS